MIDLHYIKDANLISARSHAIEFEKVEHLCAELKALVEALVGAAAASSIWLPLMEKLEDHLTTFLIHVWPLPKDPVVMLLLEQASDAMAQARHFKEALFVKADAESATR
jgi:hypothetical protein